jgi:hypothetical protein
LSESNGATARTTEPDERSERFEASFHQQAADLAFVEAPLHRLLDLVATVDGNHAVTPRQYRIGYNPLSMLKHGFEA